MDTSHDKPVPAMALFSEPGRRDPWAHRRGEPRTFAVLWLCFTLGCMGLTIGSVGLMGVLHAEVYRPAARIMVALIAVGIAIVWPMIRLSQDYPARPVRSAMIDFLVIFPPAILPIWPQCMPWMAGWPVASAAAVSLNVFGWAFLVAGLLGLVYTLGQLSLAPARWACMLVFLMLALAGPVMAVAMGMPAQSLAHSAKDTPTLWMLTSPITSVFELARERSWSGAAIFPHEAHWAAGWIVLALGLMVWGLCLVVSPSNPARKSRSSDPILPEPKPGVPAEVASEQNPTPELAGRGDPA